MRGFVFSVVRSAAARRSLALSLGLCTFVVGCGDKSTAEKSDGAAPAASPSAAPGGMFAADVAPKLNPVPDDRYAASERYAEAPRYPTTSGSYPPPQTIVDPAVQPAGYRATPPASTAVQTQVMMQTPGLKEPREEEFVPGVEDLQLFEQPDLDNYGRTAQQPQGWISSAEMLNWKVRQRPRTSPLPHSP